MNLKSLFLLIFCFYLVACTQPAAPTPEPTPTPDPMAILRQAGEAMGELQTASWQISRTGGPAYIDQTQTLNLSEASGQFAAPDAIQATIKVESSGAVLQVQTIAIGEEQWMTNPLTQAWMKLPPNFGFNPSVLFNAELGWRPLLNENVTEARLVALEETDGGLQYQIEGTVTGERVAVLSAGIAQDQSLTFNIWVDATTHLIHRLQFSTTSPTSEPAQWLLTFTDFNAQLTITPPTK